VGRAAFKAVEARDVPGGFDSYLFRSYPRSRLLRLLSEAAMVDFLFASLIEVAMRLSQKAYQSLQQPGSAWGTICAMTGSRHMNPFQWYLGKTVLLRGRAYVVERMDLHGRDLSFHATEEASGDSQQLSLFDLLTLEAQEFIQPV